MTAQTGKAAPHFSASAILEDGSECETFTSRSYLRGNYGILFFFPGAFTYVCPTEILALQNRISQLTKLNAKAIAISVDPLLTQKKWRETPIAKGGVGDVSFPFASDHNREISKLYSVLAPSQVSLRATFIIDPKGVLRHAAINDLAIGRNVDEIVRIIEAIDHFDKNGFLCPVGWSAGQQGLTENADATTKYVAQNARKF